MEERHRRYWAKKKEYITQQRKIKYLLDTKKISSIEYSEKLSKLKAKFNIK
jgi:hypothetical protein